MTPGPDDPGDLPNLDLLRAYAVVCVVGSHWLSLYGYTPELYAFFLGNEPGQTGVLLFFVHTSLVLMFSLARAKQASTPKMLAIFYLRRVLRLYPLSIFTICIMLAFRIPAFFTYEFIFPDVGTLWANLTLTQIFIPKPSLLAPLWSLPLEVMMYTVLPFLFWGVRRAGKYAIHFTLACWLAATAFVSLHLEQYFPPLQHLAFVPCFLGGVAAYPGYACRGKWPFWGWPILILLACFTVKIPIFAYCTCLVLGLTSSRFSECSWRWLNRITHTIATYSYSLYLLHVPVLYYFYKVRGSSSALPAALGLAAACWLAYHCVERPAIRLGRKKT